LAARFRFIPLLLLPLLVACASIASPDGWVSPKIVDDTVYISLDNGELSALELDTLDEIWTFPADDEARCPGSDDKLDLDGIYGAPAVGDEMVYIGAYDGNVYALSKDEGECLWTFETDDPVIAGPVLDGEQLFAGSTDGNLYVLDAKTGEQVDIMETGSVGSTPLLTEDGQLYVATEDGKLWSLASDSLDPAWRGPFEVNTGLLTPPVLTGGDTVVVGGIGATLYGVDAATGDERWSFGAKNWFWGEPAGTEAGDSELLVATNLDGRIYGVNPDSGEEIWPSINTGAPIRGGAAIDESGTAVVVNNEGLVFLIDTGTGETLEEVDLEQGVYASPVIREGAAIILTRSHDIFSVDLETGRVENVSTE
jgi:outer membrane protein assembly factor BamB